MKFEDWDEVECWIEDVICKEFIDDDVNQIYELLFRFNQELLSKMMSESAYKLVLKNIGVVSPWFVDRDTILDNLKDILLVGGSQDHSLDNFMDWEGLVQSEIDEFYEEFNGMYINYDELLEFFRRVSEKCVL